MNREEAIMEFIKQDLLHGKSPNLSADENLLETGTIDSLGILQLVAFIEERMGLEIPPEDVVYENFSSVAALSSYLDSREESNVD